MDLQINTKLTNVSKIIMGQSPPGNTYNNEGNGLPFFQGKAEFGAKYPEVKKWCSKPIKIAFKNDILLSVRAPVGPTNIAKEKCCIGRGLAAISANENIVIQDYLKYFFKKIEMNLSIKGQGSTFHAISKKEIDNLDIIIPALSEQKRIVEILDQADALRKKRAEADQLAERIIPALFYKMFGDPAVNPKHLNEVSIGEISKLVTSGYTPRGGSQNYIDEGPYFLRSQNIHMNKLELNGISCLPNNIAKKMKRVKVEYGDVLLNITGASLGRVAWYNVVDHEAYVNQHVCIIRLIENIRPEYISFFLTTPLGQRRIFSSQTGATRQGLNHENVRKIKILLPDIEEQKEFADTINNFRQQESMQNKAKVNLEKLFQNLLHKAFSGELTAQWREAHMQELLREMEIQAQYLKTDPSPALP